MSEDAGRSALRRTCLHQEHLDLEARMVPFAGWDMPVQYAGIIEEHHSVRRAAGMFDVSHMGRVELIGRRAGGGIMDDVYVYCLAADRFMLVANAENTDKVQTWLREHIRSFATEIFDIHTSTCMIAVQGPQARTGLAKVLEPEFVRSLKPRACAQTARQGGGPR